MLSNLDSILDQLRQERDQLDQAIAVLETATEDAAPRRTARREGRRTMSLAARRRIAAAQKERWRKFRQKTGGQLVRASRGRRSRFSPQHLARLRAAAKARWRRVRKSGKTR